MQKKNIQSARVIAVSVLDRFDPFKHNAASLLKSSIDRTDRKAQATDLVFGTIRNMPLIDSLVTQIAGKEPKRIQKRLLNIIRVGVYEFVFSPDTAEYAIVNEAVNMATSVAGKKQAGFVNAVLRNIERAIEERMVLLDESEITKTIPCDYKFGCRFKDAVLPSPADDVCGYYSKAFSMPEWLVQSWLDYYGKEQTLNICLASNRNPSVFVLPNTLKITIEELADKFRGSGIEHKVFADDGVIRISKQAVHTIDGFSEGLFLIQDPTATKVAGILEPQSGDTIADLCAAPGGKTMGLAMCMNNTGRIIASDIDDKRLKMVDMNAERLGVGIVETVSCEQVENICKEAGLFDAVLIDVPCSNSGVMARRPEVRMRVTPDIIDSISSIQTDILKRAADLVRPGGKICYSTCSICPQENDMVIDAFLESNKCFKLVRRELTVPKYREIADENEDQGIDYDGGYAAVIAKL